jgi:hypothetical protein
MRKLPLATALALLLMLSSCIDPADLPQLGIASGYQRALDQDVQATHDSNTSTVRGESVAAHMNWQ